MIAVTLDTSFYIGALNSRGQGSRVLVMARAGEIRIDISDAILAETIRVPREKFAWDGYRLHEISQSLSQMANRVTPQESLNVVKEGPQDNRILECAFSSRSDYILTWDKDLLRLGEYAGIKILTPGQFIVRGRVR